MPFLRFAGQSVKTRGVFLQGHRKCQSVVPDNPSTCPAREHIPPLPCHSKQWASARPSLNTSVAVKLKFDKRMAFRVYDEFQTCGIQIYWNGYPGIYALYSD